MDEPADSLLASEPAGHGRPRSVSVCICTLNRPALLAETLEHLLRTPCPPGVSLQVVVVDNSSEGSSLSTVQRFAGRLPVEYGHHQVLGLSGARNRALELASGELLLWTDDDVVMSRDWIAEYVLAAERHPEATFFGGPILPRFVGEPPTWLVTGITSVTGAYALRGPFEEGAPLGAHALPYGANFAVRRAALGRDRFDEALGWKGSGGMAGEETDLLRRLLVRSGPGRWVSRALVEHVIQKDRQSLDYLRQYYLKRGLQLRQDPEVRAAATLFGRPRFAYRALVELAALYAWRRMTSSPAQWLGAWKDLWIVTGLLGGP